MTDQELRLPSREPAAISPRLAIVDPGYMRALILACIENGTPWYIGDISELPACHSVLAKMDL